MEIFNFCPNSLVPETVPPEPTQAMSMNGWRFSSRPNIPYRKKFKVKLHGLRWYLQENGLFNAAESAANNAHRLELFYQQHQTWKPFIWHHPHIGDLIVCFDAAVQIPAGISGSGGLIEALEINLIEYNPGWT